MNRPDFHRRAAQAATLALSPAAMLTSGALALTMPAEARAATTDSPNRF
jgi:hypothetical protein